MNWSADASGKDNEPMRTRRISLAIIAVLGLAVLVSAVVADLSPGTKAPNFTVPTIDGKTYTLSSAFKQPGKVVVLDIWATWCPPCRAEIPQLVALQKKLQGKQVEFVGVAIDDEKNTVAEFAKANHTNYTVGHDPGAAKLRSLYTVRGVPATYVIDRRGVIRFAHSGFPRDPAGAKKEAALLEREISSLLAK
jgi:peroxiredoxin